MGDNYCDSVNNRAFCNYDGGDCCQSTVKTKKVSGVLLPQNRPRPFRQRDAVGFGPGHTDQQSVFFTPTLEPHNKSHFMLSSFPKPLLFMLWRLHVLLVSSFDISEQLFLPTKGKCNGTSAFFCWRQFYFTTWNICKQILPYFCFVSNLISLVERLLSPHPRFFNILFPIV